jgi:hypothetical protein
MTFGISLVESEAHYTQVVSEYNGITKFAGTKYRFELENGIQWDYSDVRSWYIRLYYLESQEDRYPIVIPHQENTVLSFTVYDDYLDDVETDFVEFDSQLAWDLFHELLTQCEQQEGLYL